MNKTEGTIRIPFAEPFSAPPVVILTPQWERGNAVGAVPTVTQITADAVVVSDNNQASDYYVNVLAVEQGAESLDGQPAFPGSVPKNSANATVTISGPAPSAVLLTPYWPRGPVGSVETLDLQTAMSDPATALGTASQLTLISGNSAADYQVNYLALSLGCGGSPVQCGIANKTGDGKQRVYFPTPFDTPPVVLLSPWWDGANSGAGAIDTVIDVTGDHFDFVSANYAATFSVSWAAVPRGDVRSRARIPKGFDQAVSTLSALIPEEAGNIAANAGSLRATLVKGAMPDPSVMNVDYAVQPSEPLGGHGPRSEKVEAAIRVGVDCFALAASLFGVWVTTLRLVTNAVRAVFNQAALDGLGYLAFLYNNAGSAWQKASAVFKMLGVLWNAGAIKAMIGALRNTMKWWDWVLAALVLLAQLAALAVSNGLALIGQLALVVLAATTLAVDIYLLVKAFGTSPPPPQPRLLVLPRDLALAT